MTQTPEPKPTDPSVSLESLKKRATGLASGVASIQNEINKLSGLIEKLRGDLQATAGAKQYIDQLIAEVEKPAPEATPEANG